MQIRPNFIDSLILVDASSKCPLTSRTHRPTLSFARSIKSMDALLTRYYNAETLFNRLLFYDANELG